MSKTISVSKLAEMMEKEPALQLIDVRSPGEYASGHVPRAMNIPLEQVEGRLPDLSQGPVAVLCQSGRRAGMACELLRSSHDDLLLVEGGTAAWIESGRTVIGTAPSTWALERQLRLAAGLLVFIGAVLALTVAPGWLFLSMFVGGGLVFAAITQICPMLSLLALMPWNKAKNQACDTAKQVAA